MDLALIQRCDLRLHDGHGSLLALRASLQDVSGQRHQLSSLQDYRCRAASLSRASTRRHECAHVSTLDRMRQCVRSSARASKCCNSRLAYTQRTVEARINIPDKRKHHPRPQEHDTGDRPPILVIPQRTPSIHCQLPLRRRSIRTRHICALRRDDVRVCQRTR
jgi:hypothetical protein